MPERIFFFVVALVFTFNGEILGQDKIVEKFPTRITSSRAGISYGNNMDTLHLFRKLPATAHTGVFLLRDESPLNLFLVVPENVYVQRLSFFCRKEWQFERATSIPLRFRLGSLAYTDYLERKPNSTIR